MTRSELQEYGADEPIWGFVAQLGRERFTGQADVGVDTRVELYVTEGRVYFAQKPDDPPLGARLVATGALTTEQLRNGSVKVGDTVSLARLFSRVPEVDRDAVELMVDRFAQQVLEKVAQQPVGTCALHPFRHHPSGIQQWYQDGEPEPLTDTTPTFDALVAGVVAQVSGEVPVIAPIEPSSAPVVIEPAAEPESVAEPAVAEPALVEPPVAEPAVEPAPVMEAAAPPPITFETLVTAPPEPETALPTLSTLAGLTPLPTLGEVGTRMPTPTMVHAPAPLQVSDLPSLGQVGVSFHPTAVAEAEAAAAAAAAEPDPTPAVDEPTIEELEAMVQAPSAVPVVQVMPAVGLEPGSPLPPPVHATGLSPLDLPSFSAMMTPSAPTANATGAPVAQETEKVWDMVDDLLGLPHPDASLVDAGPHESEKKGRGWLRGRRG